MLPVDMETLVSSSFLKDGVIASHVSVKFASWERASLWHLSVRHRLHPELSGLDDGLEGNRRRSLQVMLGLGKSDSR